MKKRKFVFGMGTGCCGTSSLARLLNDQPNAFVGHELAPILSWSTSQTARDVFAENKWEQLNHESHLYDLVGDVGSYYLPYVRFLMQNLESPLGDEVDFRFIILKRDKTEVISAFLEKFKRQGNNPLQENTNARWDEWDAAFPKYNNIALPIAIECYYEDYYAEADYLKQTFPNFVRIYNTSDLNSEEKVREILNFVGIENPRITTGIRMNKREDATVFD